MTTGYLIYLIKYLKYKDDRMRQLLIENSQHQEAIIEEQKKKNTFLTNMSHELITPMHAIIGFGTICLKMAKDNPKQQAYLEELLTSSRSLLELINSLLSLAKLSAHKEQVMTSSGDLITTVKKVIAELRLIAAHKEITLHCVTQVPEVIFQFDNIKMMQVLRNLLMNAIKFSDTQQSVAVHIMQVTPREVGVSVLDSGPGIPEDERQYIFQKFSQSSRTADGSGGSGLGLAICEEIIKQHQGTIWAMNNQHKGSKFTFVLPLLDEPY